MLNEHFFNLLTANVMLSGVFCINFLIFKSPLKIYLGMYNLKYVKNLLIKDNRLFAFHFNDTFRVECKFAFIKRPDTNGNFNRRHFIVISPLWLNINKVIANKNMVQKNTKIRTKKKV